MGIQHFQRLKKILAAAIRYRAARVSSRSVVAHCAATIRYRQPEAEKEAATWEGGSGIGIVGAGDMGSVLVGVATGPLRLCLEEAKWTI